MSLAEWQTVVDEIEPFGLPVIVMGGELFLYSEALDLLRLIKKADLPLTIITSGMTLPQVATELVDLGLN